MSFSLQTVTQARCPRSRRWPPRSSAWSTSPRHSRPNIRWRGHLLLEFEPVEAMRLFHALAFPAGVALLLVAPYLAKRRRRAWEAAVVLMLALGLFDLLKGLDFEETIVTWAAAVILLLGRDAFRVRHDPITLRSAMWRVPVLGLTGVARDGARHLGRRRATRRCGPLAVETADLLRWQQGPIHYHHHFAWIPLGVHLLELPGLCRDRLRDLPAADRAARAAQPGGAPGGLRPRPGPRRGHPRVLQAARRQAVSVQRGSPGVRRLHDRERRAAALGRPGRARRGRPGPAARGARVRGGPRAEAGRARRQRVAMPAVRGAGAADDLPRRRGGRRARALLARGSADPQGPPVGHAAGQGGLRGRAVRAALARRDDPRAGRGGGRARPPGRAGAGLLDGDGLSAGRSTTTTRWW